MGAPATSPAAGALARSVSREDRGRGAADALHPIMSVATTEWNLQHVHPKGSWWQYQNDRRFAARTQLALGIMALVSVVLIIWAVLEA